MSAGRSMSAGCRGAICADTGIVKKWADKYGITINLVQINDYVELINQYTAGKFDGCAMTNMDALTIPAAGGVDTTPLIVGDFSNGNDGIVTKKGKTVAELKGQKINHGRILRVALSAGAGSRHERHDRARRHVGQHLGCRHRRGLRRTDVTSGGDLESAIDAR